MCAVQSVQKHPQTGDSAELASPPLPLSPPAQPLSVSVPQASPHQCPAPLPPELCPDTVSSVHLVSLTVLSQHAVGQPCGFLM